MCSPYRDFRKQSERRLQSACYRAYENPSTENMLELEDALKEFQQENPRQ